MLHTMIATEKLNQMVSAARLAKPVVIDWLDHIAFAELDEDGAMQQIDALSGYRLGLLCRESYLDAMA